MRRSLLALTAVFAAALAVPAAPAPSTAGSPAQEIARPVVHRDPLRGFALHLEAGWRVMAPAASRTVDPAAAVVAQPAKEPGFLAIEARRLPAVALGLWAAAWDSRGRPGNALAGRPGLGRRYLRVQSFTTRKIPTGSFVVSSEFRRRGGWAYRISRYLPFQTDDPVRERLGRAADGFRLLPEDPRPADPASIPSTGHPDGILADGALVRDGVWSRADIAIAIRPPPGWRLTPEPGRETFLPRDLAVSMHDTLHGYQAGLVVLGEATRLEDLVPRLQAALLVHLRDAAGFTRTRRGDAIRLTCTSRMPRDRSPKSMPLTWLAEGRIVEGQALALLVGVTGLGLAGERSRMVRAFEAWSSRPPPRRTKTAVAREDGLVVAPEAGFRWRLPTTWMVDTDLDAFGLREAGAMLTARRRGPGAAGDRLPAVRARVYGGREHGPELDRTGLLGGGVPIRRHRLASTSAFRFEGAVLRAASAGREWVRTTEIRSRGSDRFLLLVSCVPDVARERLAGEQETLHREFVRWGPAAEHGALRLDDDAFTDTLRGLRCRAHRGWIWLLGGHARALEPRAVAAAVRDDGDARFVMTAERIPGHSLMRWAAYQRVKRPRRLAGDRLFVEETDLGGKHKSILAVHRGWCLRADLTLTDYAPSRAAAEGHSMLRSLRTDLEIGSPARPGVAEDIPDLPEGQAVTDGVWRKRGCPAALTIPAGWRLLSLRETGRGFPTSVLAALEQRDFGVLAALVEVHGADLRSAAGRLGDRLDKRLAGWRMAAPPRETARGVEFEARARIPGSVPGSSLASGWRVRVTRVGTRMFAILTWIKGTPDAPDRALLEVGLNALTPVPDAPRSDR